jgi:hypothetical protein
MLSRGALAALEHEDDLIGGGEQAVAQEAVQFERACAGAFLLSLVFTRMLEGRKTGFCRGNATEPSKGGLSRAAQNASE